VVRLLPRPADDLVECFNEFCEKRVKIDDRFIKQKRLVAQRRISTQKAISLPLYGMKIKNEKIFNEGKKEKVKSK